MTDIDGKIKMTEVRKGSTSYRPKEIERKWCGIWERDGYFRPLDITELTPHDMLEDGHQYQVDPSVLFSEEVFQNNGPRLLSQSSSEESIHTQNFQGQLSNINIEYHSPSGSLTDPQTLIGDSGLDYQTPLSSPCGTEHVRNKNVFAIATPPPDITGPLHCGDALAICLEDCLVRWHRMRGFKTVFIPGTDHAGVAAQVAVEKAIKCEKNKSLEQIGKARFLNRAAQWAEDSRKQAYEGFKKLGASFDWDMEAFTLDSQRSNAVTEAFLRLHRDGCIYRARKIVNWCPSLKTALSNLEVETLDIIGPTRLEVPGYSISIEFGVLYYFKYAVVNDDSTVTWINLATTCPENLLGDTGIAVHPEDTRYRWMIGLCARHPYSNRLLEIVGDFGIDPNVGTGAVTVVPGHDEKSNKIGRLNKMETVTIFNEDETVNANGGEFRGQKRFEARFNIVKNLEDRGLFIKKESCSTKLTVCSRSGDIILPLLKAQWWLQMDEIAAKAASSLRKGQLKVKPAQAGEGLVTWLETSSDWCITQQIWWGHQIPAWFLTLETEVEKGIKPSDVDPKRWIIARSEEEALHIAKTRFRNQRFNLLRDSDVLDTWFSLALWPLSSLGWPHDTLDFRDFFPLSCLDAGSDILYLWVARMIVVCMQLTGYMPFSEVLCHPLVGDLEGRKMSRALGNVIDPVDIIDGISHNALGDKLGHSEVTLSTEESTPAQQLHKEHFPHGILECGADALRFTLIANTATDADILLDINVVWGYRAFCEKLHDAIEQFLSISQAECGAPQVDTASAASLEELEIQQIYNDACVDINDALESREFSRAADIVHTLWSAHICDRFLSKLYDLHSRNVLVDQSSFRMAYSIIEGGLRLLHPFMPFITEELWQRLPLSVRGESPSIMVAPFPQGVPKFVAVEADVEF